MAIPGNFGKHVYVIITQPLKKTWWIREMRKMLEETSSSYCIRYCWIKMTQTQFNFIVSHHAFNFCCEIFPPEFWYRKGALFRSFVSLCHVDYFCNVSHTINHFHWAKVNICRHKISYDIKWLLLYHSRFYLTDAHNVFHFSVINSSRVGSIIPTTLKSRMWTWQRKK